MHAHSHVVSSLFKIFFAHFDMLKYIESLTMIESSVTVGSSCSASFFAYFFFMFLWTNYDSIYSVEVSSTIIIFDLF